MERMKWNPVSGCYEKKLPEKGAKNIERVSRPLPRNYERIVPDEQAINKYFQDKDFLGAMGYIRKVVESYPGGDVFNNTLYFYGIFDKTRKREGILPKNISNFLKTVSKRCMEEQFAEARDLQKRDLFKLAGQSIDFATICKGYSGLVDRESNDFYRRRRQIMSEVMENDAGAPDDETEI